MSNCCLRVPIWKWQSCCSAIFDPTWECRYHVTIRDTFFGAVREMSARSARAQLLLESTRNLRLFGNFPGTRKTIFRYSSKEQTDSIMVVGRLVSCNERRVPAAHCPIGLASSGRPCFGLVRRAVPVPDDSGRELVQS